ncbi:hypothetical protein NIES2100_45710 [Calothrix sp. NIES-2100]|uniref:Uma2 family endonuclease n=1 Tax=Calothrix sp. NIES-2100 TaxID=1954172 RepID=UPI000B60D7E6|nr:hypothetical protein NIES2100_45710 [Calothrix sp. NIES-2100]
MSETLSVINITIPPTQAELPYNDGMPMESQRHIVQMELLIDVIETWLQPSSDGYAGGNMSVYFSLAQLKNQDFRGPDFFVVLGVPKGQRRSWVVWEEGKAPDIVIELLSPATITTDKTEKKLIYQNQLRVPEYFWYDPLNPDDLAGFSLSSGVYQPIVPNTENQLVSQVLGLALQRWQGTYKGANTTWLRWATLAGELLPTAEEKARQEAQKERQRAEKERQRAERAELQLQRTARNLLLSGMSAEQVASITGLTELEIEALKG